MRKHGVVLLSLFLFLGLATSVGAEVSKIKVFNQTGEDIKFIIEYKTIEGMMKKKAGQIENKENVQMEIPEGSKIDGIFWNIGEQKYQIEYENHDDKKTKLDQVEPVREIYILKGGSYRYDWQVRKAKLVKDFYFSEPHR